MIGNIIKLKRVMSNLTISDVSLRTGISKVQIRNLENNKNKANVKTMYKLSEALDIDFEDLYNLNEENSYSVYNR